MSDFQHKPDPKCKHRWRKAYEILGSFVRKTKVCSLCHVKRVPWDLSPIQMKKTRAQLTERKKKINPVSDKRREWNLKYQAACRADAQMQVCAMTGVSMHKGHMDRHHPYGRIGAWIMVYVYITREDHNWIHANEKKARELGWLQDTFFGYPQSPTQPEPWGDRLPIKKS